MGKQRHNKHDRKHKRARFEAAHFDVAQLQHTDTDDCPVCKALASKPEAFEMPGGFTAHVLDGELLAALASVMKRPAQ